ncbi:MAG: hypothetical protein OEU95_08010, partial [Nitrospirota bacterium]|nr:hypothetical protein [Nitrospirota bacterium]
DEQNARELSVIENSQREDPNPMDEAIAFKRLIDEGEYTPQALADKLGKPLRYVLFRVTLNGLPKEVQGALRTGDLSLGHAVLFTRLRNAGDMKALFKNIKSRKLSVAQAQDEIKEFSTKLSDAPFDTVECKDCPARTKNQVQMFPALKKGDDCMDSACFFNKSLDHYKVKYNALKEQGFTVVEGDDCKQYVEHNVNRREIRDHWKPKHYKSKCRACKDKKVFFLYVSNTYNGKRINHGEICLDVKKCWEKKKDDDAKQPNGNDHTDSTLFQKAREMRNRFLHEAFPERVKGNYVLSRRLAILHLVNHSHYEESVYKVLGAYSGMTRGIMGDPTPYSSIMAIPSEKLDEVITEIIMAEVPMTDSRSLVLAMPEAGLTVEKDFRMDETYLKTKTKSDLVRLVKELKLSVSIEEKMKKSEMLDLILEQDLTGKTTTHIREAFKKG